ncbi:MAG: tetratricopeptide repeat protein, partial [Candidatus Sericytochromatia bacterium]|nr:tetratricopeptide repeat protein [Candidatus Sericytochromatia bacterium]
MNEGRSWHFSGGPRSQEAPEAPGPAGAEPAGPPSTLEGWQQRGDSAMISGNVEAALDAYFQVLRIEPEHTAARFNLAVINLQWGRYADAITLLRGILASRPDDSEALTALGWAQLWDGQADEAVRTFRRVQLGHPQFAPALVGLGWAHMAKEPPTLGRAADAFGRAIALRTEDREAYFGLATVCEMRGELTQAVPLLEDALRMWPDDLRAHESLARIQEQLGQW